MNENKKLVNINEDLMNQLVTVRNSGNSTTLIDLSN